MVSPGRAPASATLSWAEVDTLMVRPPGGVDGLGEVLGDPLGDVDGLGDFVGLGPGLGVAGAGDAYATALPIASVPAPSTASSCHRRVVAIWPPGSMGRPRDIRGWVPRHGSG